LAHLPTLSKAFKARRFGMEHLPVTRMFGIERCEFAIIHADIIETVYDTHVPIAEHMLSISRCITCLITTRDNWQDNL